MLVSTACSSNGRQNRISAVEQTGNAAAQTSYLDYSLIRVVGGGENAPATHRRRAERE